MSQPQPAAPSPSADRVRDAWNADEALPRLRIVLSTPNGYTQFRARVPRGALVLTLHLLAEGGVSVELVGYGPELWRGIAGLARVEEALKCS